jgi:hypothetical protein
MSIDRIVVLQNSIAWVESLADDARRRGDVVSMRQHRDTVRRILKQIAELQEIENVR